MTAPNLSNWLVNELLAEQNALTAVEKFSLYHEENLANQSPALADVYRQLIPGKNPAAGEQYAFEVDLDKCSGCKACVVACHQLNGLDLGESFRRTGTLQSPSSGQIQTVTSACHHCEDPGCLTGCPVRAYEKDDATGIVKHLDDQCIGCEYCILKCPYDVPKFNEDLGIVRKCDLCVQRLAVGEAPACAQACPSQAIRVIVVQKEGRAKNPDPFKTLIQGAPSSNYTLPTTRYIRKNPLPTDMLAQDEGSVKIEKAHWPLAFFLTLSQWAAGLQITAGALTLFEIDRGAKSNLLVPAFHLISFVLLSFSMLMSLSHLGRPQFAYKAILGWRTSWLSREILAFNFWALPSLMAFVLQLLPHCQLQEILPIAQPWVDLVILAPWYHPACMVASVVAALASLGAVGSSAMVYIDTPRPQWASIQTAIRFFMTSLFVSFALFTVLALQKSISFDPTFTLALCVTLGVVKMRSEKFALEQNPHLLKNPLFKLFRNRKIAFKIGITLLIVSYFSSHFFSLPMVDGLASLALLGILIGDIMERSLFFKACISPRMPGN